MTDYFVGIGGNDGNTGLSWAQRFLTLNAAEDEPVVPGDVVYVGPGVYREGLQIDVDGGNTYSTGTVSVTNGSDQVIGNGTTFGGNVDADYMFHVRFFDQGADGITDGTAAFEATAGNFHANLVGLPIQINARGAYTIAAVTDADNLTLADPNGLGWPAIGAGLTYSIMSCEGHYEIESQDDNTTLTLKKPWLGRTHSGLAYLTFNPITYIGDVTGENTDGVGGIVRITGSDDDATENRAWCIAFNTDDYRVFRGFDLSGSSQYAVSVSDSDHTIFTDCTNEMSADGGFTITNGSICMTIRRCYFSRGGSNNASINYSTAIDDSGMVVENCVFVGPGNYTQFYLNGCGGVTIRNCLMRSGYYAVQTQDTITVGQTVWVTNCILAGTRYGFNAETLSEIIEDYNVVFRVQTEWTNVVQGANTETIFAMFSVPILLEGFKFPWQFGELSEWSGLRGIVGADERTDDFFGIQRPATAAKNSWGPIQFHDAEREVGTTRGGSVASLALRDAGVHQMFVPVTAVETTIKVYVYREANYAGTNPRMVIKQPGVADDTITDAAADSQWNLLTTTFTPDAGTDFVVVELQSLNTAAAGNYEVFFDDLVVS